MTSFGAPGDLGVPAVQVYGIEFISDWEFVGTNDCNTISGRYLAGADGGFSILDDVTSVVECPPGSQYLVFGARLNAASSYAVSPTQLVLSSSEGDLRFGPAGAGEP